MPTSQSRPCCGVRLHRPGCGIEPASQRRGQHWTASLPPSARDDMTERKLVAIGKAGTGHSIAGDDDHLEVLVQLDVVLAAVALGVIDLVDARSLALLLH